MATWTFEELTIWASPNQDGGDDAEPHTINVEFDFKCTYAGCPSTGPTYSCGGQPAEGPEWELEEIRLVLNDMKPVVLDESQFTTIFPDGDDILTNAYEWAHEQDPNEEGDTS